MVSFENLGLHYTFKQSLKKKKTNKLWSKLFAIQHHIIQTDSTTESREEKWTCDGVHMKNQLQSIYLYYECSGERRGRNCLCFAFVTERLCVCMCVCIHSTFCACVWLTGTALSADLALVQVIFCCQVVSIFTFSTFGWLWTVTILLHVLSWDRIEMYRRVMSDKCWFSTRATQTSWILSQTRYSTVYPSSHREQKCHWYWSFVI